MPRPTLLARKYPTHRATRSSSKYITIIIPTLSLIHSHMKSQADLQNPSNVDISIYINPLLSPLHRIVTFTCCVHTKLTLSVWLDRSCHQIKSSELNQDFSFQVLALARLSWPWTVNTQVIIFIYIHGSFRFQPILIHPLWKYFKELLRHPPLEKVLLRPLKVIWAREVFIYVTVHITFMCSYWGADIYSLLFWYFVK